MSRINESIYDPLIETYSAFYGLPFSMVKAQIRQESNFNPNAVSPCGAKGLGQFMPATWQEWGSGDVFDPEDNIKAMCAYMNWLIQVLKDYELALAAYNWGIGNVRRILKHLNILSYPVTDGNRKLFMYHLPAETNNYILRIRFYNEQYSG